MTIGETARARVDGAFYIHVHAARDVVPPKLDDIELASASVAAGMARYLLKSHHGSTVERAYLVSRVEPRLRVVGGVVLNEAVGGMKPDDCSYQSDLPCRRTVIKSALRGNIRTSKRPLTQALTVLRPTDHSSHISPKLGSGENLHCPLVVLDDKGSAVKLDRRPTLIERALVRDHDLCRSFESIDGNVKYIINDL